MTALEEIKQQTGFKVVVFLGGLAPNTGNTGGEGAWKPMKTS